MKFLFVSIGDLHIENNKTIDTKKRQKLSDLINSKISKHSHLIIVCNGDIINSGTEEEYLFALDFLTDIQSDIEELNSEVDISYVFSPGNHDCDISDQSGLVEAINKKENETGKPKNYDNHINLMKKSNNQERFFSFCDLLKNPYMTEQIGQSELFRMFEYNYENGRIRIVNINSSLYFNKSTTQGDVLIDYEHLKSNVFEDESSYNILLSHYPIEWYRRDDVSKLDSVIEMFDACIVGHEHIGKISSVIVNNKTQIIVKNPMFNSNNKQINTGLTIIDFDSFEEIITYRLYEYNGNMFIENGKLFEIDLVESNGYSNKIATLVKETYTNKRKMDELIIGNTSTDIDKLYVDFPLRYSNFEIKKETLDENEELENLEYVTSDNIIFEDHAIYGFYGKLESGKSTLLNYYYFNLFENNLIPIYIDAKVFNRRLNEENISDVIQHQFKKQYETSFEVVLQNNLSVVYILDDLHQIEDDEIKHWTVDFLIKNSKFVLFSSSVSYQATDLKILKSNSIYQYEILELGQVEIYQLCENWMKMTGDYDKPDYHKKLIKIKGKINSITNKKYVPLNPFFVLLLLKANDENAGDELVNSNKRVYYEYLISKLIIDLSNNIDLSEIDIQVHFHELAFYIYNNEEPKFKNFVEHMQKKYNFDEEYPFTMRDFKNKLIRLNVITLNEHIVKFRYKFMYYTFLSKYIVQNIDNNPVDFKLLFDNILEEENSNLLLFLTQYFAKKTIIDEIIQKSDSLLFEYKEIEFNLDDLRIYNFFIVGVNDVKKIGKLKENNMELNKAIDRKKRETDNDIEEKGDLIKKLNQKQKEVIEASKMMLVINELLNNRHTGIVTENILKSAISLGRRVLSFFTAEYIEFMDMLSKKYAELEEIPDKDDQLEFVKGTTHMFLTIFISNTFNLGSTFNRPTLKKVIDENSEFDKLLYVVFNLNDDNEAVKFDMPRIKRMVHKYNKDKNYLLKGLVHSLLGYYLNYVGVSPRKTIEIAQYLNYPEKKQKELLHKTIVSKG